MVSISSCMKAQGTVEPCRGHLSPLGQNAWNENHQSRDLILNSKLVSNHSIKTDLAALLDDGVPAAGEAELVSNVARALDEVRVLQLSIAVCAFELGPAPAPRPVITPVTGAGDLVTARPGGRRPVLRWRHHDLVQLLMSHLSRSWVGGGGSGRVRRQVRAASRHLGFWLHHTRPGLVMRYPSRTSHHLTCKISVCSMKGTWRQQFKTTFKRDQHKLKLNLTWSTKTYPL